MILDGDNHNHSSSNNMNNTHDGPPSYNSVVTREIRGPGPYEQSDAKDVKVLSPQRPSSAKDSLTAGSPSPGRGPTMPPTTVYNYVNPETHEVIASLLPPDHPQMVCLQQGHAPQTRYGLLGVLAAVFWFPLGIGLCLLDKRVKCERCGLLIDDGCGVCTI